MRTHQKREIGSNQQSNKLPAQAERTGMPSWRARHRRYQSANFMYRTTYGMQLSKLVLVRPRPGRWSSSHLILLATTAAAALLCCERAAAFTRSLDALRLPSRASCLQQSSSRLEMAKGDGKKKRKKKSAAQTNAAAPAASPPAAIPMRVTSDSNISVKRQIKWAKMKKEYSQVGQSFRQPKVVRTKYRR